MTPRRVFSALLACLAATSAWSAATAPGTHYVNAFAMNVRLGPDSGAPKAATLYRRNRVDVFEIQGRWARITPYYPTPDGGEAANWVSASYLAKALPGHLKQPELPHDPRIEGLPRFGENGISEDELTTLYSGAQFFLESGHCRRIAFGDKSFALTDRYYVNCGDDQHIFFRAADVAR